MSLPVHVERIAEDRPLLTLLPDLPDDERFAFVRENGAGGEGVVGWGGRRTHRGRDGEQAVRPCTR